jgi:hypothetical protein
LLYPNPTIDVLNVNMQAFAKKASVVQLIDLQGRVLQTLEKAADVAELQFDLNSFEAGMYKIISITEQQEVVTENFIFQKQ